MSPATSTSILFERPSDEVQREDPFFVPERDEAGMRALSDLTSRGVNSTSSALAQSADHVRSFFEMLRAELGFYLSCLNLRDRLTAKGSPVCFPDPDSPVPAGAGHARLSARGLYDASLALSLEDGQAVGNDLDSDGRQLIMITGANQGGKSTFLRSVGQAYLMMQAGMFVPADSVRRQRQHRGLHPLQARGRRHDGDGQAG